ncbi:MAG: hypothetical protein QXU88_02445 [Candidatus Woesearchaeota archaeon]
MTNAKELYRDLLAIGSLPFYGLVIVRAIIGNYWLTVWQLVLALALIHFSTFFMKRANIHVGMAISLATFTSLFYGSKTYTAFAAITAALVAYASAKLNYRGQSVGYGILSGAVATLIAYLLVPEVV